MKKRDFKNKVVVITGASGNLGVELCLAFGHSGAKVVGLDVDKKELSTLEELLYEKEIESIVLSCDITDLAACRKTMDKVMQKFRGIDLLINNAGITHIEPFRNIEQPIAVTRKVMEVNFFGAVNWTTCALEELVKNQGMIITISSVAGFAPLINRTAYAASKHALHGFFETLRTELVQTGTKLLMVCPSFIGTSRNVFSHDSEEGGTSIHQTKKTIGKVILPKKIAHQILRAASHEKELLVLGRMGHLSYFVHRFFPLWYERLMAKKLKKP